LNKVTTKRGSHARMTEQVPIDQSTRGLVRVNLIRHGFQCTTITYLTDVFAVFGSSLTTLSFKRVRKNSQKAPGSTIRTPPMWLVRQTWTS